MSQPKYKKEKKTKQKDPHTFPLAKEIPDKKAKVPIITPGQHDSDKQKPMRQQRFTCNQKFKSSKWKTCTIQWKK